MDRDTIGYYLAFSHASGIGPMRFNALITHFGSPKRAYTASRRELEEVLDHSTAIKFVLFREGFDIDMRLKEYEREGIHILPRKHPRFPPQLLVFPDAPICLYAKGILSVIDFAVDKFFAIVGTRQASDYGKFVSEEFARELSEHFVVVSGLAQGIDAYAHTATLSAGGRTIAFLGCGVDIPYPQENIHLYNKIIQGGGLVLSEFPRGMRTLKGHFVSRNRHVSGLSSGVLVVEGNKRSGTLITARYAAEQGKDVFVPPVPINTPGAGAPSILLREGAKLVLSAVDILREYGIDGRTVDYSVTPDITSFPPNEQRVLKPLLAGARRIDDIIHTSGLVPTHVMNVLTLFELNGTVIKNMDGTYQLA